MRKIAIAIILLVSSFSYALHVECVGNAVLLEHDGDTLLVWAEKPELVTKNSVGAVDWYQLPDTVNPVQTGTDYLYPEHGEGYMLKIGNSREVFWTFDYQMLQANITQIDAELSCENTQLKLQGDLPAISYRRLSGQKTTYLRLCQVEYTDAVWDAAQSQWGDTLVVEEAEMDYTIGMAASAAPSAYIIRDAIALQLGLQDQEWRSEVYEPIVVKAQPQAIVTVRGKEGELSNEVQRPVDTETIINRSAPLTISFKANALNASYYEWIIYRGSEKYLQRTEAQHQYTFEEPGSYRMVLGASNKKCSMDSAEFIISVSESMLKVPNVFTPNSDGANDEFRVVYKSIKEYHIWVYNRWGHLVYESTDPAKGWDGTIGGRPAAEGAYYYVIRALGTDAESDYMSKIKYSKKFKKQDLPIGVYQLSGAINLIRGGRSQE